MLTTGVDIGWQRPHAPLMELARPPSLSQPIIGGLESKCQGSPRIDRGASLLRSHFPAALLFDMDGTLTEPMLDFAAIKAEMRIGQRPILEAMTEMSDAEQRRCQLVLDRHEDRAAAESTLNP